MTLWKRCKAGCCALQKDSLSFVLTCPKVCSKIGCFAPRNALIHQATGRNWAAAHDFTPIPEKKDVLSAWYKNKCPDCSHELVDVQTQQLLLDAFISGQHWIRLSEESNWMKCPLGMGCPGLLCKSSRSGTGG